MTQFQKLLHELYGEYIEQFGFKPIKNGWCRVSSHGIAGFIGTRLLSGGALDFWMTFRPVTMPVFGDYAKHASCETPVTFFCYNIKRFPLGGKAAFEFRPELTRKGLLEKDDLRHDVSEKMCGIFKEHFEEYLQADMTLEDCIAFNRKCEDLLGYGRYNDPIMNPYFNTVIVECLLLLNKEREYCLECFQAETNAFLGSDIAYILDIPDNEQCKEHVREIIGFVNQHPDLEPMEYARLMCEKGYKLKPDYDKEKYLARFEWLKGRYAEIISLLKSGASLTEYFEKRHSESAVEYKKMKIEVPPFSCCK